MLTIERQIEDMAAHFPDWTSDRSGDRSAIWHGRMQPYSTRYSVRIEYTVPLAIEYRSLVAVQPLVEILEPELERRPGNEEGELPHVYWRLPQTDRAGPFLCVFDADAGEWTLSDPLSRTTVPFTMNWLMSYEGWLASGKWLGFGRHPGKERTGAC